MRIGSRLVLALKGELDINTVDLVNAQLTEPSAEGFDALTLDLSGLSFIDSSGLKLLLELNHRAEREGWRLALVAPEHEAATLVLRVTGANELLPFERPGRS